MLRRDTSYIRMNQEFGGQGSPTPGSAVVSCPPNQRIVGFTTAAFYGGINYLDVSPYLHCSTAYICFLAALPKALLYLQLKPRRDASQPGAQPTQPQANHCVLFLVEVCRPSSAAAMQTLAQAATEMLCAMPYCCAFRLSAELSAENHTMPQPCIL